MRPLRLTWRQQKLCFIAPIFVIMLLLITGCQPEPNPPVIAPTHLPQFLILNPSPETEFEESINITISGTHEFSSKANVWIFLQDIYKRYYVQSPSVELLADGTWEATNIRIGPEIQYIIAIYVDGRGNDNIQSWVRTNRWGQIEEEEIKNLSGYYELTRVRIMTPSVK